MMRLRFLCPHHRNSLQRSSTEAYQFWIDCEAILADRSGELSPEHVKLAGSALEAASIFLQTSDSRSPQIKDNYRRCAEVLTDMLVRLEQPRLAAMVVSITSTLIVQSFDSFADQPAAATACGGVGSADATMQRSRPDCLAKYMA